MARYFRLPFGTSGDRTDLPDTTTDSAVSYDTGYTMDYELDPETAASARLIERSFFNQLMFDVTSTLQLYYQTGTPPFIAADDNGGTAFSYSQNAKVLFNGRVYESLTNNNTTEPTNTTNWRLADFTGMDATYALRSNNLSDLASAATARTNLGNVLTQTETDARYARQSNNLSDLDSAATARTNLGNVLTQTETDARYAQQSNNLSDLDNAETARTNLGLDPDNVLPNLGLGTAGLYNAFTGHRDLAVVPVGLISQWHNSTIPPDDWVIARGQSTSVMSQRIKDIFGATLPDLQAESTNTEAIIHTGPLVSDFFMPLRDNLDIVSGTGLATFTLSTTSTYVDRFGALRMAAINEPRFEREGILIEGSSTNLIVTSEQLDQWRRPAGPVSIEAGSGYGEFNSWIVTRTSDGALGIIRPAEISYTDQVYTAYVRVKPSTGGWRIFIFDRDNEASIRIERLFTEGSDTPSGVTTGLISESFVDDPYLPEWKLYTVIFRTANNSSGMINFNLYPGSGVTGHTSEFSTPQIESLPFSSSYIPTEDSAITRGDSSLSFPTDGNIEPLSDHTILIKFNTVVTGGVGDIAYRLFNYGTGSASNYFAIIDPQGRIVIRYGSSAGLTPSPVINDGNDHILIIVVSGTTITGYMDGTEFLDTTVSDPSIPESDTFGIGYAPGAGARRWNGRIKDFRIWRRTLRSTELP